jgi:hypothetical protein
MITMMLKKHYSLKQPTGNFVAFVLPLCKSHVTTARAEGHVCLLFRKSKWRSPKRNGIRTLLRIFIHCILIRSLGLDTD